MVIEKYCPIETMLKSYDEIPSAQRIVASRAIIYPRHIISLRIGHDHRNDRSRSPEYAVASTDRRLPVATTRLFHDFVSPNKPIDQALVNVPLGKIGSNFFGSATPTDRVLPVDFSAAGSATIYHQKGANINPTVGDWEKASGKLTIRKNGDGTSLVSVTIRNAFPNAVYTLWDIGVKNPLTSTESLYAVPMGGVPNIVITDAEGCGFKQVKLPYVLDRACTAGASSCTSYVSAFFHWDNQGYGASPDGGGYGAPVGVVGSNQLVFPTSGTELQAPATRFPSRHHGCNS